MEQMEHLVKTAEDLLAVAGDATVRRIVVAGGIAGLPTLRLAPGQHLTGASADEGVDSAVLSFAGGGDGIRLSRDNEVSRLRIQVDPWRRAIVNDTTVDDLGTLRLTAVTTVGQVQILARDRVRAGHVLVDGLDVVAADVRDRDERPELLGVGVLQGAFTLWNQQRDENAVLTADLRGIAAGRDGAPVRGSGVFVAGTAGNGGNAGRLEASVLETGPVFTDGGIPEGTHDTISGGVFVVYGAHVGDVRNRGPITTYGVNDMVLDNWGTVDRWIASAPLTSYGRSGVGFVNFGAIGSLRVEAPVETYGVGARGFNVYRLDGHTGPTVETAEFDRITTHADAAIGIQIGQPIGRLTVHGGILTHGGTGESLVRGEIVRLSAYALSVQPGGRIDRVDVDGGLDSAGACVPAVEVKGKVGALRVAGGIHARGRDADALHVDGGSVDVRGTEVTAADGVAIRLSAGGGIKLRGVDARGARGDVVVERVTA
jgi:hypothetical protein